MIARYFRHLLIAVDQLLNAILGGYPDESLSSVAYRLHRDYGSSWRMHLIDTLFFWDTGKDEAAGRKVLHCELAYLSEVNARHLPPEARP